MSGVNVNRPGRGVSLAQSAMRAHALGDGDAVMKVINAGTHAELAWACGYLLSALGESVLVAAKGDREKARRAMWAAANNREDAVFTQALAVVADAIHDIPRMDEE